MGTSQRAGVIVLSQPFQNIAPRVSGMYFADDDRSRAKQTVATANNTAIPAYVAGRPTSATAIPPTAGPAIDPASLILLIHE